MRRRRKLFCQYCGAHLTNDECTKCKKPKKEIPRFLYNAILVISSLWLLFVLIFLSWSNFVDSQRSIQSFFGITSSGSQSSEISIERNDYTNACICDPTTKIYHYSGCPFIKENDNNLVVYLDISQAIDEGYIICDICDQKQKWGNT